MGGWASTLRQVLDQASTAGLAVQSCMYSLVRESAARAVAHEEKLAAAEARIAAHEEKLAAAERRLKASDTTFASLQAELRAVREMATKTQQAALRNKPSREQVLVLLQQKADFSGLDFSGLDLSRVCFRDAELVGANFEDADLSRADLRGANLQYAKFAGANVTGADMRDSQLNGAVGLGKARLDLSGKGSKRGRADLRGATHSFKYASPAEGSVMVIKGFLRRWDIKETFQWWDPQYLRKHGIFSPGDL